MGFKIVGANEENLFPPRVEDRLARDFASKQYVDTEVGKVGGGSSIVEDSTDPGFFVINP